MLVEWQMFNGSLFHVRGPATEIAWSPILERVRGISNGRLPADRRCDMWAARHSWRQCHRIDDVVGSSPIDNHVHQDAKFVLYPLMDWKPMQRAPHRCHLITLTKISDIEPAAFSTRCNSARATAGSPPSDESFLMSFTSVFAARCYKSAAYAVSVCVSVRPSRSWILSKQINIPSTFFTIE